MKPKLFALLIIFTIGSLIMTACGALGGGGGGAAPTAIPTVVSSTEVVAEGRVVPNESANLSFNGGGQVTELLITEGDAVEAGQVIARLGNAEQLQTAVANAEAELLNAQQARKDLLKNAEVDTAAAAQAVADARDAVREAERRLTNLKTNSRDTTIDLAKANVVLLKDKLDTAWEDYQPYQNKPVNDVTRATFLARYSQAKQLYEDAVRKLNNLTGTPSQIDVGIADANLSVAQAKLLLAQQTFEDKKAGPDPDQLASADARIKAAETGLTAAKAALDDIVLKSPFAGKVVDLKVKVGEQVAPGQVVAILADFSQWIVETDDLTEIEIPEVRVGQSVKIVPDALPDLELGGTVDRIKDVFEEKRGDITYTVRIKLNQMDDRLRWGMTVAVTFQK